MTVQIDSQVSALFQRTSKQGASATADTGEGWQGEWPSEGVSDNAVTGITMKAAKIKRYVNGVEREFDCVTVRFAYENIPNENEPGYDPKKPRLKWQGKPMDIVSDEDFEGLPEENSPKYGFKRNGDRLKGFAVKLLNRSEEECSNMGEFCTELAKLLGDDSRRVIASIRCEYRPYETKAKGGKPAATKIDKTDFCVERLDRAT